LAHTKNRGDRAGSGIKPWRQKGTGRARVGSVRTPTWRKGGVAFGPRNDRNFNKDINKKMNAKAIAMVLSGKAKDNELIVVDKFDFKEKKTKEMAKVLKGLKIKGKILLAVSENEKDLNAISQNIAGISVIPVSQLNVFEMLKNKNMVMSEESVKYLESKYGKK
jgi:large subunit ribosomal protein L4